MRAIPQSLDNTRQASPWLHHYEVHGVVPAAPDQVFQHLDEHGRLSSHMAKPSWKMGGGSMDLELDEARRQRVGSRMRLHGKVFGVDLSVEEVITERVVPLHKAWQTIGSPRLLVMGSYRMGFDLRPSGKRTEVRVFLDYSLPTTIPARWFGWLLGRAYARWCTGSMIQDAARTFGGSGVSHT